MPKRALVEKRPWLLASLAAAIAYYLLKDADFPGTYLLVLEGSALLMVAVYAVLRHHDADSRLLAGALCCAGLGVVAVELDHYLGALLLIVGNCTATVLFVRHRREAPSLSQKAAAVALLLLVPFICWRIPIDREAAILTGRLWPLAGRYRCFRMAQRIPALSGRSWRPDLCCRRDSWDCR